MRRGQALFLARHFSTPLSWLLDLPISELARWYEDGARMVKMENDT